MYSELMTAWRSLSAVLESEETTRADAYKSMSALLSRIVMSSEREEPLTLPSFNPYSRLTRHHLEEFHTRFIGNLLDPGGDHGMGSVFLEAFLHLRKLKAVLSETLVAGAANVRVEKVIPGGRVDILISFEHFHLIIENKIRHEEAPDQIKKYGDYFKSVGQKVQLCLLSLDGRLSISNGSYSCLSLSYSDDIFEWLKSCRTASEGNQFVQSAIVFYMKLLDRNYIKIVNKKIVMNIVDHLLQPENHILIKYQKEICNAVEEVRNRLRTEYFLKVFKKLTDSGLPLKVINADCAVIESELFWRKRLSAMYIGDDSLSFTLLDGRKLSFILCNEWSDGVYFGLHLFNKESDKLSYSGVDAENQDATDIASKICEQIAGYNIYHGGCYAWRYVFPMKNEMHVDNDELNYYFASKMDQLVEELTNEILQYLNVVKSIRTEYTNNSTV